MKTRTHTIIVAAGSGQRFGSNLPKQYCLLGGRPVLMYTIDGIRRALPDGRITLVISQDMRSLWDDLCRAHHFRSPRIVYGGKTRWESVRNALQSAETVADITLVHDGARPVISPAMVQRLVAQARISRAAIPALPLTDSIREVLADGSSRAADRSCFRTVQTPQAFATGLLNEAYAQPYCDSFTDDASVVEAFGKPVSLVAGDARNIKITYPGDLAVAGICLAEIP